MNRSSRRPVLAPWSLLVGLTCAGAVPAQTVTVGPAGSGAMFTSIQDGIDAAPPGGVVLVAAGGYSEARTLTIDKALTVLGAGSGVTHYAATTGGTGVARLPLVIEDLQASDAVLVAGLRLHSVLPQGFAPQAFVVRNCAGPVVLADLRAAGSVRFTPFDAVGIVRDAAMVTLDRCWLLTESGPGIGVGLTTLTSALLVERSLVHVQQCRMVGITAPFFVAGPIDGAPGIRAVDATVRVARSQVFGGHGMETYGFVVPAVQTAGGAAIAATGSAVLARGGPENELRGGRGGNGVLGGVPLSGPGGAAVLVDATSLVVTTPDVVAVAGPDGDQQTNTPAIDGPGLHAPLAFPLATIAVASSLVAPGATADFALAGEPGALCLPLLALTQSNGFALPGVLGLFTVGPAGIVPLAPVGLDAGGTGAAALAVPPSPSLAGTVVHAQSLSFGPGGWISVSGPAAFAVR